MSGSLQPAPYADVNAVLAHVLTQIRGMYLDGSLALGDFNPQTTDIDIVVTAATAVSEEHFAALRALHARFNASASPWATEVEAVYLPASALRCSEPEYVPQLRIERGRHEALVQGYSDRTWITHWCILRDHPAVLAGPDPRTLIDPVDPDALRRAMADLTARSSSITSTVGGWTFLVPSGTRLSHREFRGIRGVWCTDHAKDEHGGTAPPPRTRRHRSERGAPFIHNASHSRRRTTCSAKTTLSRTHPPL